MSGKGSFSGWKQGAGAFLREHRGALVVLGLLLVVRLMTLYSLGFSYTLNSDDASYLNSGITFARTGPITMHNQYPSAQIMPGMTVLIGLFVLVFGEGKLLWLSLKLLWILMDLGTAWFLYRSVSLFTPKWCGWLGMLPLFRADFLWMNSTILTETPFLLALTGQLSKDVLPQCCVQCSGVSFFAHSRSVSKSLGASRSTQRRYL